MKLNHINLAVTDVQEAMNFLVKYFGMRNMGANKGMGFLTDEDDGWGFVLTLMKAGEETQGKYPGTFHIGFFYRKRRGRGRNQSSPEGGRFRRACSREKQSRLWILC